jgi:hypothetical protein
MEDMYWIMYEVWGFHGGEDNYCDLLDYNTVWSGRPVQEEYFQGDGTETMICTYQTVTCRNPEDQYELNI